MPLQAWQVQSELIPPQTRQSQLGLMQLRSRRWRSQPAPAQTQQAQSEDAAGAQPMRPVAQSRCVQALLKAHAAGLQIQAVRACVASLHAQPQPARRAAQSRYVARYGARRCSDAWTPLDAGGSTKLMTSNMSSRHVACGESDWGPWLASARVTGCPWLANKQALTRSRNGFALLQRHDVWRHDRLGSLARKRESDWVPQDMSTCKCGHAPERLRASPPEPPFSHRK